MLVLVIVVLIYFFGDLGETLDDLNTLLGLGLFAYLWAIAWVATSGALRRLGWPDAAGLADTTEASVPWGGFAGAAVVIFPSVVGAFVLAGYGVLTLNGEALLRALIIVPFGIVAGAVAFGVGGLIGLTLGVLDYALVRASEAVLDAVSPSEVGRDA